MNKWKVVLAVHSTYETISIDEAYKVVQLSKTSFSVDGVVFRTESDIETIYEAVGE